MYSYNYTLLLFMTSSVKAILVPSTKNTQFINVSDRLNASQLMNVQCCQREPRGKYTEIQTDDV